MNVLPIEQKLPQLLQSLATHNRCLLQAEPGAGKTTRVPPALLDQPWLEGRKILMLEPRRIAARNAAAFMARQLNEKAGQTVGYRLRLDTRVGPDTRIEVVTEGILTRMLQQDPALETVGCVIFDEFHERSLQADLGLALILESQQLLRPDLRLLVMSATLEAQSLTALLGDDLARVQCPGRAHPVSTQYINAPLQRFDTDTMAATIDQALGRHDGSLLVFCPGGGEIRRLHQSLQARTLPHNVDLFPLYGALSPQAQDRAIRPSPPGRRKVVLATDIAESSLTIDGVNIVVDSGLTRKPRFDPRSGMSRLVTHPVSAASAEQRRGRAGRQGPGHCYRLWSETRQHGLEPHSAAEIVHADLAPLALELARWGSLETELQWLDPPPAPHLQQARTLLRQLGALDSHGRITAMGRAMNELGSHPRLAHMMLKARELNLGALGCDLAALLGERDLFAGNGPASADLRLRVEQLRKGKMADGPQARVRETSKRWQRQLQVPARHDDSDFTGLLLSFAFPDRIARRRRDGGRQYQLRNGRGAQFRDQDALCNHLYLVAADLDAGQADARIFLAAPITEAQLREQLAAEIETREDVSWDAQSDRVKARRQEWLGALRLSEQVIEQPDSQLILEGLLTGIRGKGLDCLPWNRRARNLQARLALARKQDPDGGWPDCSDPALLDDLEAWLVPYLDGMQRLSQLKQLDLYSLLLNRLDWHQQQQLEQWLPERYRVPSGSNIAIDYSSREEPQLSVRIQELFGLKETPTLLQSRLPLTIELLSPAQRPIQITRDLASFWTNTYREVCKDLKGRYPKHYWPEDPTQAQATRGTKKQLQAKPAGASKP